MIIVTSSEGAQLFFVRFHAFTNIFLVVPQSGNAPHYEGVIIWYALFESALQGTTRT